MTPSSHSGDTSLSEHLPSVCVFAQVCFWPGTSVTWSPALAASLATVVVVVVVVVVAVVVVAGVVVAVVACTARKGYPFCSLSWSAQQ